MNRRNYILRVRLLADEEQKLRKAADDMGLAISDFVRRKVLGPAAQIAKRKAALTKEIAALVRAINALGNNLNQLTKFAHSGAVDSDKLNAVFAEIERVLSVIGR